MKKNKIWKIIWISCIYAILLIILYLVVLYKVKWEDKDFNTYLYFYNCNNSVCSSITKPKEYYNKIVCEEHQCPYISSFTNNILILTNNNKSWLYDYKNGSVYNDNYIDYVLFKDDFFIVTDQNSKQGIINKEGKEIVAVKYDKIIDYNFGLVVYKENNLYGIDYASGQKVISPKYDEVIIINNTMYAAMKDNKYQIYNVVNNSLKSSVKYDFVWTNNNFVVVIANKQLDILNNILDSNLLMKIDTYLDYNTTSERKTLKMSCDDDYIYFNINTNNKNYIEYKYDITNKKIISNK